MFEAEGDANVKGRTNLERRRAGKYHRKANSPYNHRSYSRFPSAQYVVVGLRASFGTRKVFLVPLSALLTSGQILKLL